MYFEPFDRYVCLKCDMGTFDRSPVEAVIALSSLVSTVKWCVDVHSLTWCKWQGYGMALFIHSLQANLQRRGTGSQEYSRVQIQAEIQ